MNCSRYFSTLFLLCCTLCFCTKEKKPTEFVRLIPSNLQTSSDHRFQDLEIKTVDIFISNNFPDTIWIYKAIENDYLICSFDLYYYSSDEFFRDDYAPHSPMNAGFFPIPPFASRNYKAEYLGIKRPEAKLQYVRICPQFVADNGPLAIKGYSTSTSTPFHKDTLYQPEYVFRVDPNNSLQRVFINIDSVWQSY